MSAGAALLVAACGSGSAATSSASSGGSNAEITVAAANVSGLGTVLVNGDGRTLYMLSSERGGKLTCTDDNGCTKVWPDTELPPGVTSGMAGSGVDSSKLATVRSSDGKLYLTYGGWTPVHVRRRQRRDAVARSGNHQLRGYLVRAEHVRATGDHRVNRRQRGLLIPSGIGCRSMTPSRANDSPIWSRRRGHQVQGGGAWTSSNGRSNRRLRREVQPRPHTLLGEHEHGAPSTGSLTAPRVRSERRTRGRRRRSRSAAPPRARDACERRGAGTACHRRRRPERRRAGAGRRGPP